MAGKVDIDVHLAALDRLGPATKRIRDEIDRQDWSSDPGWCAKALNALADEDRDLEARESEQLRLVTDEGRLKGSDRELKSLKAARLRLRETIAEVSGIAVSVCRSSPLDVSPAKGLFMRQRAELWSARTGFGAQGDTLGPLPRPRGRRPDIAAIERDADVLAALRMAENEEERASIVQAAQDSGIDAKALKAWQEGDLDDRLEEMTRRRVLWLENATTRRVAALEQERNRDPGFQKYLILFGWTDLRR